MQNGQPQQPVPLVQFQFVLLSNGKLQLKYDGPKASDTNMVMSALMQVGQSYLQQEAQKASKKLVTDIPAGAVNRITRG